MSLDPMTSREQWEAEEVERYDAWLEEQHRTELDNHAKALWKASEGNINGMRDTLNRLEWLISNARKVQRRGPAENIVTDYQLDLLLAEWGPGKLMAYLSGLAEEDGK